LDQSLPAPLSCPLPRPCATFHPHLLFLHFDRLRLRPPGLSGRSWSLLSLERELKSRFFSSFFFPLTGLSSLPLPPPPYGGATPGVPGHTPPFVLERCALLGSRADVFFFFPVFTRAMEQALESLELCLSLFPPFDDALTRRRSEHGGVEPGSVEFRETFLSLELWRVAQAYLMPLFLFFPTSIPRTTGGSSRAIGVEKSLVAESSSTFPPPPSFLFPPLADPRD